MRFAEGVEDAVAHEAAFTDPAAAAGFWAVGGAEVATRDLSYPGGAGQDQRLRLYRGGDAGAPTFLYIHGGGWAGGSIELHDRSARGLAVGAHCNVVSISYRLAPARPYPAGLEDTRAAARWLREKGAEHGLNPARIAVGGASAGANLAAAVALAEPGSFGAMLLFYGVFGCDFETPSYRQYESGPGLTRARMQELFAMYDPEGRRDEDPLITPLLSENLASLPPTTIIAAEHDVLREENAAFAERLEASGVPVTFHVEPGVTHGFINRGRLVPSADACVDRAARLLSELA